MDLEASVRRAASGDLEAFAEVTRRLQYVAFGYALSFVRDFHTAEDVVQEAFVAAWYALPTLAEPAAFAAWLRAIVRHQAHRTLRRRQLEAVPLEAAQRVPADAVPADRRLERHQQADAVFAVIRDLPRALREVVVLFYVHDCSQQDIATFLGLPVTTVNNRLHAGRVLLKKRMVAAMKDTLGAHQLPDDFAARIGWVVRAREHVVEARFDPASLPDVLTELGIYPAVDPLTSRSRLLESPALGREHLEIAHRTRQALALLAPGAPESNASAVSQRGSSSGSSRSRSSAPSPTRVVPA